MTVPMASWLAHMQSGRTVDVINPRPEDIHLADIAYGMSRIRRWNGQARLSGRKAEASVGQHKHAVICGIRSGDLAEFGAPARGPLSEAIQTHLKVHDFPEAFTGDIISPMKAAIAIAYGPIEERLEDSISTAIGIQRVTDPAALAIAHDIDRASARAEALILFPATARLTDGNFNAIQIGMSQALLPHVIRSLAMPDEDVETWVFQSIIETGGRPCLPD